MNNRMQWGAILIFVALFAGVLSHTAQAVVLRVSPAFPVDVINCATGAPLVGGVNAGASAVNGDTCQLDPGVFIIPGGLVPVILQNLTIKGRDGSTVTAVTGGFQIFADGVTIENLSISGSGAPTGAGIVIGFFGGVPALPAGAAAPPTSEPDEDIRIEDNFINFNPGAGIAVLPAVATQVEDFHFEGNEIRSNGADGILFFGPVSRVMNITIVRNIIDSNGLAGANGITFFNTSNVDNISIQNNEILRSGGHGVFVAPTVTNVQDFDVENNIIQANGNSLFAPGGSGVTFANFGQVEANISNNRDGDRGINGNACSGIFVDGVDSLGAGPFYGGGVSNAELIIDGNFISRNGLTGACPGVTIATSGNVDDLEVTDNEIDQNSSDGVLVINTSDFSDSIISGNTMSNNGNAGAFFVIAVGGNGFTAMPTGDVESITFENNIADQNFVHGSLLVSLTSDVQDITFSNEQYSRNGVGLPGFGGIPSGIQVASFGSISNIDIRNSRMESNGGPGIHIDSNGAILGALGVGAPNPSDMDNVTLTNNELGFNGASAPVGSGDGVFLRGEQVSNVTATGNSADANDDNGIHISGVDDVSDIEIMDNALSSNDRNNDEVGAGLRVESATDVTDVMVKNNSLSSNEDGVAISAGGQNISNVVIDGNPEINDNNGNGVEIDAPDDLNSVEITNNTITGNRVNISVRATDRGDDVLISGNRLVGASGTGIELAATGVEITQNDIRNHSVGIMATRSDDSGVHNNNIVRNDMGIDATGLGSGEELDATNNWWGEPSGPDAPSNPNGLGDEITSKVLFQPFLSSPVGDTGANFQIFDFNAPGSLDVGENVTISATVRNTGTEEGNQSISIQVKDSTNTVVSQEQLSTPLNPGAETTISLSYQFSQAGTFQVTVTTGSDSQTKTIVVGDGGSSSSSSIASAIDTNGNGKINDDEILEALVFWITSTPVPGTGGQRIDDVKILELLAIWIKGESV